MCAVKEFGLKVAWRNYGTVALRTNYAFRKARERWTRLSAGQEYAFTFQTQSLFDFSLRGVPHFIYTDGTHQSLLAQMRTTGPDDIFRMIINRWRCHGFRGFDSNGVADIRYQIVLAIIRQYAKAPGKYRMEKSIFDHAAKIFVRSRDVEQGLIAHYACRPDQVVCAFKGSHLDLPVARDAQRYARKNIIFVGLEWERKGGPDLIKAFREVRKIHPDASLTIIGLHRNEMEENVTMAGRLSLEATGAYYQRASVFCMPSRLEPFGNVFIEAMTAGLPIVGTRLGAIPDFVNENENGYLVEPGDIHGLAAALIELMDDPEKCRRFGEKSYQIARERYTWENTGRIMKNHIEKVLAAGSVI